MLLLLIECTIKFDLSLSLSFSVIKITIHRNKKQPKLTSIQNASFWIIYLFSHIDLFHFEHPFLKNASTIVFSSVHMPTDRPYSDDTSFFVVLLLLLSFNKTTRMKSWELRTNNNNNKMNCWECGVVNWPNQLSRYICQASKNTHASNTVW